MLVGNAVDHAARFLLLTAAPKLAFLKSLEVVVVSSAAAVDLLLAGIQLLVVGVDGEGPIAIARDEGHLADIWITACDERALHRAIAARARVAIP
jgi:hypothetical protein